jgi:iron complex outermembrane recepter protein
MMWVGQPVVSIPLETTKTWLAKDRLHQEGSMRTRFFSLVAVPVLTLACMLPAALQAQTVASFDLPAQPLVDSLKAIANQSNSNVFYEPGVVAGKQAKALKLSGTVDGALKELLEGTGLTYTYADDKTIRIVLEGEGRPAASVERAASQRLAQADTVEPPSSNQEPAPRSSDERDNASSADPAQDAMLEEVVVTAQKRKQSIKEVPLSVSAISGEDLELRDVDNALGLQFVVPSLSVAEFGAGRQVITVRGVSSGRGTSSLTGVYLDEIPVSGAQDGFSPAYVDLRTIDLERVEVLKGPQGTLFGEGAVGGVIRYMTRDPELNELGGRVTGTFYGTEDGGFSDEFIGILNVPIAKEVFGIRIAATYEDKAGWIDKPAIGENDFNDNEVKNARLKALWRPTPDLALRGLVNIHRNEGGGTNSVNLQPLRESRFQSAFDPAVPTDYSDEYEIYNLTGTYDLKFAELLSSTSRTESEGVFARTQFLDGDPVPFMEILIRDYALSSSTTSQELRLTSSGAGPFNWVVGGSYKESEIDAAFLSGVDAVLFSGAVVLEDLLAGITTTERSEAWAGFANASYLFMDRLEIGGGVRYFSDDREVFDSTDPVGTFVSGSFDAWTYRAYVRFAVSDGINLYINIADGFRSGGFNDASAIALGAPATFDPETSVFYEAGAKTTWLDGRVGFDVAFFKGKYEDRLEDVSTNLVQYTVNTGEAEIEGFEWLLSWRPIEPFSLSFSGDVTDTENTVVDVASGLSPVLKGDPLNFVPDRSLALSANYAFAWAPGIPGHVDLSFNRKGEQFAIFRGGVGLPLDISPPVEFLQASIGAEWNGFQVSLFGRNLLDERGPINPSETGDRSQARPRSIGVAIGKKF